MANKKRIVLQPEYMKSFRCIGANCEDSCCIGWRVNIDKEAYLKYKKINHKELKPIFSKNISKISNSKSPYSYGEIELDLKGRCAFLDEENLCRIHGTLGEEYLSYTCATYPRCVQMVDGGFERSASMSCPEIGRLALLNPKGMAFEQIEEDSNIRMLFYNRIDTAGYLDSNRLEKYFWEIRMFSLSLLQNRDYNMGERLIILGIVYKEIEELYENGLAKNVPATLEEMGKVIEAGILKGELEKVPINIKVQMRIAQELIQKRISNGLTNERYVECVNEMFLGLSYNESVKDEDILKKYEYNYNKYLASYLKEKEYIIENYLVNEYFKELMPFGKFKSVWDSYIFLCVLYSMVKLHLIGLGGYHKGLNDELTLQLIQSLSKQILHNSKYIEEIISLLKDNKYDSLGDMSILVKN
ncbi:MAG: flagellin lysine-N-methylase [Anaeromicrobium sp.]|uniref:flagellin lysine-N-methylase n=1 Tax=Anaeromicrobium sp. TaxID=1929132 RepID=UPI0025D0E015|nr:flagellin lysine-N-methylase [Anaeromicrobium sp.]MCT4595418.1 flagellin lysine-N-methylase [Anaeromicrobium sp.]